MTKTGRDKYLNALHSDFLKAAEDFYNAEYQHHFDFSGHFEKDKTKDSFGREFKNYFEESIQIKNAINHRTLINVVKGGFAHNAQKNTLNNFSKFLGFADFDDFCKKKYSQNINYSNDKGGEIPFLKKHIIKIFSVITFGILLFLSFNYYHNWVLSKQKSSIIYTIKEANNAQFKCFKELPNIKFNFLERYYLKNGKALNLLKKILFKHRQNKLTIGKPILNPSYFNIQEINFQEISKTEAVVVTKEYWYLKWYNLKSKKYELKYDVSNTQFYKLVKENEFWKIESNDYQGESKKIDE